MKANALVSIQMLVTIISSNLYSVVLCSLMLLISACSIERNQDSPRGLKNELTYELSVSPESETEMPIGTIFSIADTANSTRCTIGFPFSYSSRTISQSGDLQFSCSPDSAIEFKLNRLGKPDYDAHRPSLINLNGNIVDVITNKVYVNGGWVTSPLWIEGQNVSERFSYTPSGFPSYSGLIQSVQLTPQGTFYFKYRDFPKPTEVYLDGIKVFETEMDLSSGFFWSGRLWISTIGGGELIVCDLIESKACVNSRTYPFNGGYVYAFAPFDGALFFTDSHGIIWKTSTQEHISEEYHASPGEFYSLSIFNSELIAGHYPSGKIFRLTGSGWVNGPTLVDREDSLNVFHEAQSLAIFGHELYAGVWPFGRLWKINSNWSTQNTRLFSGPLNETLPPYCAEFAYSIAGTWDYSQVDWAMLGYASCTVWSQRVQSLTVNSNGLYIGTGANRGVRYEEQRDGWYLSSAALFEYGHVWELTKADTQVIAYKKCFSTVCKINIKITPASVHLSFDGFSYAIYKDFSQLFENGSSVVFGDGIFGKYTGSVTLLNRHDFD